LNNHAVYVITLRIMHVCIAIR